MNILLIDYTQEEKKFLSPAGIQNSRIETKFLLTFDSNAITDVKMHFDNSYRFRTEGMDITPYINNPARFNSLPRVLGWDTTELSPIYANKLVMAPDKGSVMVLVKLIEQDFPNQFIIRLTTQCHGLEHLTIPRLDVPFKWNMISPIGSHFAGIISLSEDLFRYDPKGGMIKRVRS